MTGTSYLKDQCPQSSVRSQVYFDNEDVLSPMAHQKLEHSLKKVDKAGDLIRRSAEVETDELAEAIDVLFNWRSAHSYPLNSIHMTLRRRVKAIDKNAITAQRIKRLESIDRKLKRFQKMHLSQMQDVGGCRAILGGIKHLNQLLTVYEAKPLRHEAREPTNYVSRPKDDGYRGIHLMYRFVGKGSSLPWHELRIEIQLRTKMQHAWATALETVDTFREGELKFGGGDERWRRFFQLAGSANACMERTPCVPNTPDDEDALKKELKAIESELGVLNTLRPWSTVTRHFLDKKGGEDRWYFIEVDPEKPFVVVKSFSSENVKKASQIYDEAELKNRKSRKQAVLVSSNSIDNLTKAYPNYFADTALFTASLKRFLGA